MRVSIRTQLSGLFILSGLIAIAVISLGCWVTVRNFVLGLRVSRYAQIAALKAKSLSLSLQTMDNTVQVIAGRSWLQDALLMNLNGTLSQQLSSETTINLANTLTGRQQQTLALQTAVWPADGGANATFTPLFNATSANMESPHVLFPYINTNGSAEWLGGQAGGMPMAVYPNFTHTTGPGNTTNVWFNDRQLGADSAIFLGPLWSNSTFVIFSLTRPVVDNTGDKVLGWLTVILDGRLILDTSQDPVALLKTGLNLIVGPDAVDNRFANTPLAILYYNEVSSIDDQLVRFVLPPARDDGNTRDIQKARHMINSTFAWRLGAYPAVNQAFTTAWADMPQGGALLARHNENGYGVGAGYATPQSNLCDWIFMVEYTSAEVYAPVAELRNVILICVFSTLAALLVTTIPITGVWAAPVRRLRAATAESVAHYSDNDSVNEKGVKADEQPSIDVDTIRSLHRQATRETATSKQSWRESLSSFNIRSRTSAGSPQPTYRRKDIHKLTGAKSQFRIPPRVKERKCLASIKDELSDLTRVFNEMSDELSLQYTRLEERVRERTRELEPSKKAAEAANESKSLFIANISHELKTPLNGILGMTSVCMREDDPVRIREDLKIIYRSGDLLHNLLTDLLTFSKNQAGQALALEEKRFRLRDIGTQIRAVFDNQARNNEVKLAISYEGPRKVPSLVPATAPAKSANFVKSVELLGDQNRILQVVINLVGNALKLTPRNGNVWLRLRLLHHVDGGHQVFSDPWAGEQGADGNPHLNSKARETARTVPVLNNEAKHLQDTQGQVRSRSSGHNAHDGEIEQLSDSENSVCWFVSEVEDTGPGIDKEIQQKIFEPFIQGDVSLARKHGGAGLGLSICSQLAKLMHGEINVDSEPGRGSIFSLKIPLRVLSPSGRNESSDTSSEESLHQQTTSESPTSQPSTGAETETSPHTRQASVVSKFSKPRLLGLSQPFFSTSTPPMASPTNESMPESPKARQDLRILVAEDNDTNRRVVCRLLELEDVSNVIVAKDGEEAFEKVKESMTTQTPFDLVLMDVQMPKMDGRQSTKLIRQAGFTSPIVALTAFTDDLNERECFESGMDLFIGKPIKKQELRKVLRRYSLDKESLLSSSDSRTTAWTPVGRPSMDKTILQ